MVVELFYLLAFIVGLGAFFVVFVLRSKEGAETKMTPDEKPSQIVILTQKHPNTQRQEKAQNVNLQVSSEQRQSGTESQCQQGELRVQSQNITNQRNAYLTQISKTQQLLPNQAEIFSTQVRQLQKFVPDLPKIIETNSEVEGRSRSLQESSVAQRQIDQSSQLQNYNQSEHKSSFIKQLNDESGQHKEQIRQVSFQERIQGQQIEEKFSQNQQNFKILVNFCLQTPAQEVQDEKAQQLSNQINQQYQKQNNIGYHLSNIQHQKQVQREKMLQIPAYSFQEKTNFQVEKQNQEQEFKRAIGQNTYEYTQEIQNRFQPLQESKAQRISTQKSRQRIRLEAMKNHYKKIIVQLQNKLEQVCIRNNESFSLGNADQTITFSEQDSILNTTEKGDQDYFLELKAQEVYTLKEQLKLQEQIITDLLEKDQQLKSRLQSLQEQNKNLKESTIVASKIPQIHLQTSSVVQGSPIEKTVCQEKLTHSEIKEIVPPSPKSNLYTSHTNIMRPQSCIFGSLADSNFKQFSAISMISVIEGAISIGLLNQCRFLNEISKKFAMNEIKKATKLKFIDSELIYSNSEVLDEHEQVQKFSSGLKDKENLIFLIKLLNGKTFAFYIKQAIIEGLEQKHQNFFVFIDLSKRKSIACSGNCKIHNSVLIWGDQQITLKEDQFISISNEKEGRIVTSILKALELFQPEKQDLTVEFLYVYVLYPEG